MKKGIFIFAWFLSYQIPITYLLFYGLTECFQSDLDSAFISEQTLGLIIILITFPIIFILYKKFSNLYLLAMPHLMSIFFLTKLLTKYFIQTTMKGIQPCIVMENDVVFGKIDLTNYQDFQEYFTNYYRLYAIVGIFSVITLIVVGFKMFKINKINSTHLSN
jgi:hypothetical protein